MFVSKHVVFLEKESFLRGDSGSKVELGEGQNDKKDVDHLIEPKVVIHSDEVAVDPSEAQALRRKSGIYTALERYRFLINEQRDVLLIEDDEPTTYEESLNSSKFDKWFMAMRSEMGFMYAN